MAARLTARGMLGLLAFGPVELSRAGAAWRPRAGVDGRLGAGVDGRLGPSLCSEPEAERFLPMVGLMLVLDPSSTRVRLRPRLAATFDRNPMPCSVAALAISRSYAAARLSI